ncbi:VanZ family protein [Peristeroidobacter soli]|uniref:VanZ family protein n=1 Tax=Peristeroidobacter soli TaxID=2497877 RepID=UPI00101BAF6A|nr:VanZ family protein [Peristeroidobacter soli]
MLPLRFPRLWLGLGWLAITLAIIVCLVPSSQLPQPPSLSDKSEHFICYLLLSCWFAGIYPRTRYWVIGIGLLVMGILIEFAQGAMGLGRQADVNDVFANGTGIVAGLLLCWWFLGGWAQRLESLVGSRVTGTQKP